jgi:hypothetical protein
MKQTKTTTLAVSPAFIVKAHKVACSSWKTKLEKMYPSVFGPSHSSVKMGDKITIDGVGYMICQIAVAELCLINLTNGNRYNDIVMRGVRPSNIPVSSLIGMLGGKESMKTRDILINGEKFIDNSAYTAKSSGKTLTANIEDIKDAYSSTTDVDTKKMIKDYFPEVFKTGKVQFIQENDGNINLSTTANYIDGVDFFIGYGLAPNHLRLSTITCSQKEAKPEIIQEGGYYHVVWNKVNAD